MRVRTRNAFADSSATAGTRVAAKPGMSDYPIQLEVSSPPRFDRIQLLLRIAFAIVLGWFGITAGWLVFLLYFTLPLIAAIAISSIGGTRYIAELAPRLWNVLSWLLRLSAYMALLTDRFPTDNRDSVQIDARFTGQPTVRSALVRLLMSIPAGVAMCALWIVSSVVWIIEAIFVLIANRIPASLLAYQRGVLRWQTRLVAHHASLVDEYPPFSFDAADDSMLVTRTAP